MSRPSRLVVAALTLLVSAGRSSRALPSARRAGGGSLADPRALASDPAPPRRDGRRTMRRFVPNLLRGTVGIVSTDNIKPLLIGGAATGIGAIFDDDVAGWIADPEHGFGTSLEAARRRPWWAPPWPSCSRRAAPPMARATAR